MKIVAVLLSIVFLCNTSLYACLDGLNNNRDTLRVPLAFVDKAQREEYKKRISDTFDRIGREALYTGTALSDRMIALMAAQAVVQRQARDASLSAEKQARKLANIDRYFFNKAFRDKLNLPIEIREEITEDPGTGAIYVRYGDVYVVIRDDEIDWLSSEEAIPENTQIVALISNSQDNAIINEAHRVGDGFPYSPTEIAEKIKILKGGNFTREQWKFILRSGRAGKESPDFLKGRRILIVNDTQSWIWRFSTVVKEMGAEEEDVHAVEDVSSAIEAIERGDEFDGVVLDMGLPGRDNRYEHFAGLQVIEYIVAKGLNLPIFVTSLRVKELEKLVEAVSKDEHPELYAIRETMSDFIIVLGKMDLHEIRAKLLALVQLKDAMALGETRPFAAQVEALERYILEQTPAREIIQIEIPQVNTYLDLPADSIGKQIIEAIKDGKAIALNLNSLNVLSTVQGRNIAFLIFRNLIVRRLSVEFGATKFVTHNLPELLENAFLHGNKLNFSFPIYFYSELDDARTDVRTIKVYDMAVPMDMAPPDYHDKTDKRRIKGYGIRTLGGFYARWNILDAKGDIIGTQATVSAQAEKLAMPALLQAGDELIREKERAPADSYVTSGELYRQRRQMLHAERDWREAIRIYTEIGDLTNAETVRGMLDRLLAEQAEAASAPADGGKGQVTKLIEAAEAASNAATKQEVITAFNELGTMRLHGHIIRDQKGRVFMILGREAAGKAALAGKIFENIARYGNWDLLAYRELMALFDPENPDVLIAGQGEFFDKKDETGPLYYMDDREGYVTTRRKPECGYHKIDAIIIIDVYHAGYDSIVPDEHILTGTEVDYDFLKKVLDRTTTPLPGYLAFRLKDIGPRPDVLAQNLSKSSIPIILVRRKQTTPEGEFDRMVAQVHRLTQALLSPGVEAASAQDEDFVFAARREAETLQIGLSCEPHMLEQHNQRMEGINAVGRIAGFSLDRNGALRVGEGRIVNWGLQEYILMRRSSERGEDWNVGEQDLYTLDYVPVPYVTDGDGTKYPAIYRNVGGKAVRLSLEEIENELGLSLVTDEKEGVLTMNGFVRWKAGDTARVFTVPGPFDVLLKDGEEISTMQQLEEISPEVTDTLSALKAQGNIVAYRDALIDRLIKGGNITVRKAACLEYKGTGALFRHYSSSRNQHLGEEVEGQQVIILGPVGTFPEGFGVAGHEEHLSQRWQKIFAKSAATLNSIIVSVTQVSGKAYMSKRFTWETTVRLDEAKRSNGEFIALLRDRYPDAVDDEERIQRYAIDVARNLGWNARAVIGSGFTMNSGANELDNYGVWGDLADIGSYKELSKGGGDGIYVRQLENHIVTLLGNLKRSELRSEALREFHDAYSGNTLPSQGEKFDHDVPYDKIEYATLMAEDGIENPEVFVRAVNNLLANKVSRIRVIARNRDEVERLQERIGVARFQELIQRREVEISIPEKARLDQLQRARINARYQETNIFDIEGIAVFNIDKNVYGYRKLRDAIEKGV